MSDLGTQGAASYDLSAFPALITGAAGDIGRAVAFRLASAGARVALTDLPTTVERLEMTRQSCAALVGAESVVTVPGDVIDPHSVESIVDAATEHLGAPQLVFNNAGYQGRFVTTADYPVEDFARVMSVNVIGVFHVLRACARRLRDEGKAGAIVNSASMAGVDGAPNMVAYSASKGAVISLTRSAARDLAPSGIRVNAVSPAFIGPGAMWERQVEMQAKANSPYYSADPAVVAEEMIGQVPMARYGTVDEVAATVCWLLSPDSSYITGQNVHVTGGL